MDGKCYLCRKHFYNRDGQCPGCGTWEPGFRPGFLSKPAQEINVDITLNKDGVTGGDVTYGYHKTQIKKGVLGEASKIREEYEEFLDANEQKNSIMELVELSDLIGAIEAYTKKKYSITMDSLLRMTRATQRAFKNGHRK